MKKYYICRKSNNMKHFITTIFIVAITFGSVMAQNKVYDTSLDGMKQIREAVATAQKEGKYVLCQVGGNWCPWCLRFAEFAKTDETIAPIIEKNFVYIHVNYSNENKNAEAMKYLGNPARFGFPVFVILNEKGKPIHIQNSAYLEEGKGYNTKLVSEFLLNWTKKAVTTLK